MAAVPSHTTAPMQAEELQFLRMSHLDLGVLSQQAMQIGSAPFLGAETKKIGQSHNSGNAHSRPA